MRPTLLSLLVAGSSCTDSSLEPAASGPGLALDDELRLSTQVCLEPPADASFPVKILFIVDTSDSMSVTDRDAKRSIAVGDVISRYQAQPGVTFGVIAFDSGIDGKSDGFSKNPPSAGSGRLAQADRLTDYQGALGAAYQMISEDALASSPAERARTKYVIVFFSDGAPDPQCSAQVTPCGAGTCPIHQHCRAGVCKADYLICTVPRREWEEAFDPPLPPDLYPELDQGADYNQMSQILRAVDDIIGLQDFYHLGEIRLHTAFLYDPEAASDPLAGPFGLDREGGVELLTAMAQHGFGTFTEFTNADSINFLNINYTSFKAENGLAMVLATNLNVVDTGAGLKVDSDGDGIIDENEVGKTCVGISATCADPTDSDGDGYTDLFEEMNRISGFDPKDAKKPLTQCASNQRVDSDGDLLRDCEESFLKTDRKHPDTDGDRIPDGIELRLGLDPLNLDDAYDDPDRDGERSLDEVKAHTHPMVALSPSHPVTRYLYDIAPFTDETGQECFNIDVRHIKLMTTGKVTGAGLGPDTNDLLGVNRVVLYVDQAPLDRARDPGNVKIACVDVRYVDNALKSPASGVVPIPLAVWPSSQRPTFYDAKDFKWDSDHCENLTSIPMPTADAGVGAAGGP